MPLFLHLSIHIILSIFAGLLVWLFFKKNFSKETTSYPLRTRIEASKQQATSYAFIGAIIGGFLIDFDHFIDYFLAFGFNFKLNYFVHGYEFLKTDKIYILFHGWEYVILLAVLGFLLAKNKKTKTCPVALRRNATGVFIFALALGAFFHLGTDVVLNEGLTARSYSIIFRAKNDFHMERVVTPEHYQKHLEKKYILESLQP